MESQEHRERDLSDEIWNLMHDFFKRQNQECASIRFNLKEINDHLGNLRLASLNSSQCFQIVDAIPENRRKLHPLRNELKNYSSMIVSCYIPTIYKLRQILGISDALKVLTRIEDKYQDLRNEESDPWFQIINKISKPDSNSASDIAAIEDFQQIFKSLGVGIQKGSAPTAQSFSELKEMLEKQKKSLSDFSQEFKPIVESFTAPGNPLINESDKYKLKGKLEDINGLIGGYFSMLEAIIANLFNSYNSINRQFDEFSRLCIEILEAMKIQKIKERSGKIL